MGAISKALAEEWSSLSQEEKQPYLDKAKEDLERYTHTHTHTHTQFCI
jgi:hypothetical protein